MGDTRSINLDITQITDKQFSINNKHFFLQNNYCNDSIMHNNM